MEILPSIDSILTGIMEDSMQTQPPHILVAEDDSITRALICQNLRNTGYEITETSNGEDCISAYQNNPPDLVLLDAMMPGINGFDCCAKLMQQPNSRYVPILMITGLDDQSSVEWAFRVGATDYITKPIHWTVLRNRIRILIDKTKLQKALESTNLQLTRLATVDVLTDLANRRVFTQCIEKEWRRLGREKQYLSLLMIDVDCFKRYNDTYGHQSGDHCLRQVAKVLNSCARRPADLAARYGGEEFGVILPNTPPAGAIHVAETMKKEVRALELPHPNSLVDAHVTISVGAATVIPNHRESFEQLIKAADEALYEAKDAGRNQVKDKILKLVA